MRTLAAAPERRAAKELAQTLQKITGAEFPIIETGGIECPERAIIIGSGQLAKSVFADAAFDQLESEEIVIQTKADRLLLAGGGTRGTFYAVSRFLQDQCGVRWWTPWASRIPSQPTLRLGELNVRAKPAFEYREPFCRTPGLVQPDQWPALH